MWNKFYSSEVWFQKYNKNMDHPVHTQGSTGYSAVCFIEYDKDNHKPTTFISPFCNNFNGELTRYEPDVEEGDIIFSCKSSSLCTNKSFKNNKNNFIF